MVEEMQNLNKKMEETVSCTHGKIQILDLYKCIFSFGIL